jgi:lipopolysaccharide biosynthesis protein
VTPRLIAFHLTQFHPTPENDEWWGKGFTEWTNTTKAYPLYAGHYQPHLPTDLGFYDLRLRQSRRDQIAMARQHGIDGFCYYYYWFSGTRLLHEPLDDMLADPDSDMPFCLCWANENWTRRWDAGEDHILIEQKYRPEDALGFIKSVEPFLKDKRYIHVDGAPVLLVYRPQHIPDAKGTLKVWRDYCASIGIPKLHLVCALTRGNFDYEQYGFDAGVEFPPHHPTVPRQESHIQFYSPFEGIVLDYADVANLYLDRTYPGDNVYRGVFPSWDNTARVGSRALIVLNGTPENYEHWLGEAVRRTKADHPGRDRLVFINAWNEWAEGCHLEPDRKYGRAFLDATLRVKQGTSVRTSFAHIGPPPRKLNYLPPPDRTPQAAAPQADAIQPVAAAAPHPAQAPPNGLAALKANALRTRKLMGRALNRYPKVRQKAVAAYMRIFERR